MSSWILDLVIKDAEINEDLASTKSPIWFVVQADGLQQPFSTKQVQYSRTPSWNYPARLVLKVSDISQAYMYVVLCTFGPDNIINPLCRARVGLRNLPIGSPKTFKFPLMQIDNNEWESATVRCVATLSSFTPQVYLPPAMNRPMMNAGMQQMGGNPQYMQQMNNFNRYY